MQFNLKKDEINRLKVFNSYLKSCNNTAALKTEQLFVIDNNKTFNSFRHNFLS